MDRVVVCPVMSTVNPYLVPSGKGNTMRISPIGLSIVLLASGVLCGSVGAANGQESKSLGHRVKENTRDATDALHVTPKVKTAILEDGKLNDRRNHINVNTKDYVVHLVGHVYNSAIKERAGHIAAAKLAKMHKNYKVSNELSIGR